MSGGPLIEVVRNRRCTAILKHFLQSTFFSKDLDIVVSFSAQIDFRRQNLKSYVK